jgi:hypothetical protein
MKALLQIVITCAFLTALCNAQTAILMPMPVIQFSDVNGNPLAGGYVYTYEASTSINQATYTDSTGTTVNTDPVVLNAAGEPSSPLGPGFAGGIYLTNGANYRICVFSSSSVQQWCANNIQLFGGSAVGSSLNGQVLYNCAGAVCGSTGLTYNPGTQTLDVTSIDVTSGGSLNGTFTGSPTFAAMTVIGEIVAGSLESDATVNCPGKSAAAFGFIAMCQTDIINWENSAGSGTEGFGVTAGTPYDVMNVAVPGGMVLTGTIPGIAFGGTTVGFPAILGTTVGPGVEFVTATGSAPVAILALNANLEGVTMPSTAGPFTAGEVLTIVTPTTATFQAPAAFEAGLAHYYSQVSGTVAVTAGTPTTWLTQVVTMPSSGCPCRVIGSYGMFWQPGTGGGVTTNAWLYDGTNMFAGAQSATGNSGSAGGLNGSALSRGTPYANSAIVTFSAQVETGTSGSNVAAGPTNAGAGQFSWMDITVIPSN